MPSTGQIHTSAKTRATFNLTTVIVIIVFLSQGLKNWSSSAPSHISHLIIPQINLSMNMYSDYRSLRVSEKGARPVGK